MKRKKIEAKRSAFLTRTAIVLRVPRAKELKTTESQAVHEGKKQFETIDDRWYVTVRRG